MSSKFVIKKDRGGQFMWNLVANSAICEETQHVLDHPVRSRDAEVMPACTTFARSPAAACVANWV